MSDKTNPKDLLGINKTRVSLLPAEGILQGAKAMQHGAAKYGPYNWRTKNVQAMIYIDAIMRHTLEYLEGSNIDADSGLHPMAHVVANGALLLDALKYGCIVDNRPSKQLTSNERKIKTQEIIKEHFNIDSWACKNEKCKCKKE